MAILGNILGNLLGKADTIIDECITSTEEKMQLKNELQKIIQEQEALIEQEVTKRWESDNLQSSWLPRNIRPFTIFCLVPLSLQYISAAQPFKWLELALAL